jgi:hypothetical protein
LASIFLNALRNGTKLRPRNQKKREENVLKHLKSLMKLSKVLGLKNLILTLSMQHSMRTTTIRL